jgi:hypothetical protein
MGKLKLIIALIVIAVTGLILGWQYAGNASLREGNDRLRQNLAGLKQFADVAEPAAIGERLTDEQNSELVKLRDEATQLRAQTNQIAVLVDANQKLRASLSEARAPRQTDGPQRKRPEDALPQDIHPRKSWAFRGYASPEATVETLFWAQVNGDNAALMQAFSPEMRPDLEKLFEQRNLSEDWSKTKTTGFRIVERKALSDDQIALTLYTDRPNDEGKVRFDSFNPTVLQRIGGEWKITDKQAP